VKTFSADVSNPANGGCRIPGHQPRLHPWPARPPSKPTLSLLRPLAWEPDSEARRQVADTVRQVAARLGNTPAVCRRCYIHPAVLEHFQLGRLADLPRARARKGLELEEVSLLRFLQALARQNDH